MLTEILLIAGLAEVGQSENLAFYIGRRAKNRNGCAITADGTNGSQTFNDLGITDHAITAGGDVHHDSGENLDLRTAGIGFGSGTDTAYNDVSISFDGTGDVLTVGADGHDDFHFGTNDFTIEFGLMLMILTPLMVQVGHLVTVKMVV